MLGRGALAAAAAHVRLGDACGMAERIGEQVHILGAAPGEAEAAVGEAELAACLVGREALRDRAGARARAWSALVDPRDRPLECLRDLRQPRRTNPVDALLVFMDLLEGQTKRLRQPGLADADHEPRLANAIPHMGVDRIGSLPR